MVTFDFWYGDTKKDVAFADCTFYPNNCEYRGNMYNQAGRCIGDFWSKDSVAIEKAFPGVFD